jgi:hypothetical protein
MVKPILPVSPVVPRKSIQYHEFVFDLLSAQGPEAQIMI